MEFFTHEDDLMAQVGNLNKKALSKGGKKTKVATQNK